MAITCIRRMRDCGVFRDFSWPGDLPEFAKYNLIYGWNGSGKTTLSRLFRALETKTVPSGGQVAVVVDGRDVSHGEFGQVTLPLRVFNRDFIAESVFPAEGEVAPIFVLGRESVEKQKRVERLKADLAKEQTKLGAERTNKTRTESALDSLCIDKAGVIRDALRSGGSNPYNNYDKRDFRRRAEKLHTAGDHQMHELSTHDREKLLTQIRSTPKSKLESFSYELPDLKAVEQTCVNLLSTTVVAAVIQSLKDDPDLSSWVHRGLGLFQKRDAETCLFCDQPFPRDRLTAMEAHFSTEYEELLRRVDDQISTIRAAIKTATELSLPNTAQFYDDLSSEYDSAAAAMRAELDSAKRVLEALVKALEDKKNRAFERVALNVAVQALKDEVVDDLNQVIVKQNQVCDDFQIRINSARTQLELDSVASNLEEFVELGDTVQAAEDAVTSSTDEVNRLEDEITRLEREIVEHRQPAEELNEDLRDYLGHGELRLEIKETGYTIMRYDAPAVALSEGEITAIALLYFLKSLQDRRFDLTNGVVVLDDPVSSLDQNALFAALGYIRAKTKSAAQVFVFTHSFTFFRLVREWFRNLRGQDKRAWQVYMLKCDWETNGRAAAVHPIDPLLMEFDSEYHYLFSRVYRIATDPPAPRLEAYYSVPSMARRVLETFLAFRVPDVGGQNHLWSQMDVVPFEEAKRSRIYRFLQTHSHRDAIGDADEDLTLLTESRAVLNDLLAFIKTADQDHYTRMIARVAPNTNQGAG
jgi:wobble nucleotide-excising tRNase